MAEMINGAAHPDGYMFTPALRPRGLIRTLHYSIVPTPLTRGMDEDYVAILVNKFLAKVPLASNKS